MSDDEVRSVLNELRIFLVVDRHTKVLKVSIDHNGRELDADSVWLEELNEAIC